MSFCGEKLAYMRKISVLPRGHFVSTMLFSDFAFQFLYKKEEEILEVKFSPY